MTVTAAQVKALRDLTGAGMMECKKALVEVDGDLDNAVELMRKNGLAKADKKAGRVAAEGRIAMAEGDGCAALLEVNSETDFVAGGEQLTNFADRLAELILSRKPESLDNLLSASFGDEGNVDEVRRTLVAKLGENISVRRFVRYETMNTLGLYVHGSRIGVMVEVSGGDERLARDIAMHVAASQPVCIAPEDYPKESLEKEREIALAQAEQSGKPPEIVKKMVEGRLRKYLNEVSLYGQPFVKNPDQSVGELLKESSAVVRRFVRFEVGEGIERESVDFASEVMAQVQGA